MRFKTLKHLAGAVSGLAPDVRVILFGSTSIFGTHPEVELETDLYEQTFDADFVFEPWDAETSEMLREALGKQSLFFSRFSYYADINNPGVLDNFPPGFRDRLVPLDGHPDVFALEPHDMAVAKLIAGRPKDVRQLSVLLLLGKLDEAILRTRLWFMPMDDKLLVKTHHVLRDVVAAAREQGYVVECSETPWKDEAA